jgi:hypothetical protein
MDNLYPFSLPGVFAAGDVRAGNVKRVASAVGEGFIAISSVHPTAEGVAMPAPYSVTHLFRPAFPPSDSETRPYSDEEAKIA